MTSEPPKTKRELAKEAICAYVVSEFTNMAQRLELPSETILVETATANAVEMALSALDRTMVSVVMGAVTTALSGKDLEIRKRVGVWI